MENKSPLERAVRLVEHVSRSRDSRIFGEEVEFRIRQKWILVCAFFAAIVFLWLVSMHWRGRRKKKIE